MLEGHEEDYREKLETTMQELIKLYDESPTTTKWEGKYKPDSDLIYRVSSRFRHYDI